MLTYSKRFRVCGWSNWHRHYIGAEVAAVVNQIIGAMSATNARAWLRKSPSLVTFGTSQIPRLTARIRGRTALLVIPPYSWQSSAAAGPRPVWMQSADFEVRQESLPGGIGGPWTPAERMRG